MSPTNDTASSVRRATEPSRRFVVHIAANIFGECECSLCRLLSLTTRMIDENQPTSIDAIQEIVGEMLYLLDDSAPSTRHELLKHFNRFIDWCRAMGIQDIGEIGPDEAATFIFLPVVAAGVARKAKFATCRNRRLVLRKIYMQLRKLGCWIPDPTVDVVLPSEATDRVKACSDSELARLRRCIQPDLFGNSYASLLALAESGATNTEISSIKMSAIDLVAGSVNLHGTYRTKPRTNQLTGWGLTVLEQRATQAQPDDPIVCNADGNAASTAVVSQYFNMIVSFARVYGKRLTIDSVRYWGARQVYDRTGRVEDATYFLGNVSLNTTAAGIGLNWRKKP